MIALLLEKICDYRQMNQALLFMQMLGMLMLACQAHYSIELPLWSVPFQQFDGIVDINGGGGSEEAHLP